jgi:hypothetical protein
MAKKQNDQGDQPVLGHIKRLVDEEHKLFNQGKLAEDDSTRLERIQMELDQCWDLLRQRRARREFGQDPNEAQVRSSRVVEHYEG